jgi:hypothetical protein
MRWLLKRWWFWAWTGFVLVVLTSGYLLMPVEEIGIGQACCDRIDLGSDPLGREAKQGEVGLVVGDEYFAIRQFEEV